MSAGLPPADSLNYQNADLVFSLDFNPLGYRSSATSDIHDIRRAVRSPVCYDGCSYRSTARQLARVDLVEKMPQPTKMLLAYVCAHIVPFSEQLGTLQEFHHSQTSVLSVDPGLVAALRREYLSARGWSTLDDSLKDVRYENTDNEQQKTAVSTYDLGELRTFFRNEAKILRSELSALDISKPKIHKKSES